MFFEVSAKPVHPKHWRMVWWLTDAKAGQRRFGDDWSIINIVPA
jgi:hypothetical protein